MQELKIGDEIKVIALTYSNGRREFTELLENLSCLAQDRKVYTVEIKKIEKVKLTLE